MRTEERRTTNERKQTGGTKAEASEKKKDRGGGGKRLDIWYWSLTRHSKKENTDKRKVAAKERE